jgi:hypothetical protein
VHADRDIAAIDPELLEDPRLAVVHRHDLRYGWSRFGKAATLPHLLRRWAGAPLSPEQAEFVARLQQGRVATLGDDIRSLGAVVAEKAYRPYARVDRAAAMFAARYGASEIGSSLAEIADAHGCTTQRVSQVLAKLDEAVAGAEIVSMPALAILENLKSLGPTHAAEAERAVGLCAGNGHSIDVFRRFCIEVLRLQDAIDALAIPAGSVSDDPPYAAPFLALARGQCSAAGAAHLPTVAGQLMLDHGLHGTREEFERFVDTMPALRWIVREEGWFTRDDVIASSALYKRVREALSIAKEPLRLQDLLAAVLAGPIARQKRGSAGFTVPVNVLDGVVRGWPGIEIDGKGRIRDRAARPLEEILSGPKLRIYTALAERGGVARKAVVIEALDAAVVHTAHAHVSQAPWVYAIGSELYALMGWPITAEQILAAGSGAGPDDLVVVVPGGAREKGGTVQSFGEPGEPDSQLEHESTTVPEGEAT